MDFAGSDFVDTHETEVSLFVLRRIEENILKQLNESNGNRYLEGTFIMELLGIKKSGDEPLV